MLKNKLGIFLNSKNKKTYFLAFPLLSLIVILFFQNCGKKFQVVDLASTGSVVAESDPSILKGKFLEVHADPEAHTSQKVSFYVIKSDNGGLFLLDKNNYPHGAFDAIKRNSSVTVHLSNESIGTVLLSKNQMMKVNSISGLTSSALKPEQVLSSDPPVLIKIKGDLIYQNLPVMSSLTAEGQLQNKQQSINTKTAASGEADLNVAVVTFSFRNIGSADLGFAAFSTDAAVQQLNKNSYNKIRLHFDKDSDAYSIDNYNLGAAGNYDGCEHWITYSEQANRYAAAQGATKNKSYHRVVTILPSGIAANAKNCNWAGITDGGVYNNLDSIPHIVSKGAVVHTIAHELGHTLDLGHSGAQNMNDPYADTYDVMGRGDFFNGAKLLDLKWRCCT